MHWTVLEKVQLIISNKKQSMQPSTWSLFLRINAVFQNAEGQNWEVQKTNIAKKVWNLIKEKQQKQTGKKEGRR